jgi:hypothetical protein
MRDIKQSGINAALNECDRLRALTQQQAEQIAELVEYAKGLREVIEELDRYLMYGLMTEAKIAKFRNALAKPMPKAMKEDS